MSTDRGAANGGRRATGGPDGAAVPRPSFSVILAARNAAATIRDTAAAVLAQTRTDLELIVIDDGSDDGTLNRLIDLASDPRLRLRRQSHAGTPAALNTGIALARGRFLSMIGDDALWLPRYLATVAAAFEEHPDAGFVHTDAWLLDPGSGRVRRETAMAARQPPSGRLDAGELLDRLVRENVVSDLLTVRREVIEQVGGYDAALPGSETYELCLRIAASGSSGAWIPGPLAVRRDPLGPRGGLGATKRSRSGHARRALRAAPPPELAVAFPALFGAASDEAPSADDAPTPDDESGGRQGGLSRTVVRGVSLAGAGYGLSQILTFVAYLVLAKLIVPADFGHFAAATVVVGVGSVIGESGMLAALIQRRDRITEAFNSAVLATLGGGLALSLLALASSPLVGLVFHSHETGVLAAAMSGWMLLDLATIVPDAWLQRRFSFFRRVIVDPLTSLVFGVAAIAAAAAGMGVWALVIGTYAAAVSGVASGWLLAGWWPNPRLATWSMWRELARFGRPVVGSELIRRLIVQLPVVALGRFAGASALGQFTYASRAATQPLNAVVNAGGYVLLPAFARLSGEEERFRAALLRALKWICVIAFPAGLILIPLGTPAIVLVFGERWRPAGHGAMALGVYCAALAIGAVATEAWKAAARPDLLPRLSGISLALTAVAVGALVPFGVVGVTIGMSVAALGSAAYAVRGMSVVVGIPVRRLVSAFAPALVASLVMVGVLLPIETLVVRAADRPTALGLVLLTAEAAAGAAVYLGALRLASPQTTAEILAAVRRLALRRRTREAA